MPKYYRLRLKLQNHGGGQPKRLLGKTRHFISQTLGNEQQIRGFSYNESLEAGKLMRIRQKNRRFGGQFSPARRRRNEPIGESPVQQLSFKCRNLIDFDEVISSFKSHELSI